MLDSVYNDKILKYAARISRIGRLDNPDATSKKYARLCGSTITVDLKIENCVVTDFAHEVRACVLGQASASLLACHIIGKTTQSIKGLHEIIYRMLTENGPPPSFPFEAFACLQPIKKHKIRHTSTMLIFDAVMDCIKQIEEK
ncbi:iron-sulfur cluster assembly scaffold protein [Bartonella sp. B41]